MVRRTVEEWLVVATQENRSCILQILSILHEEVLQFVFTVHELHALWEFVGWYIGDIEQKRIAFEIPGRDTMNDCLLDSGFLSLGEEKSGERLSHEALPKSFCFLSC